MEQPTDRDAAVDDHGPLVCDREGGARHHVHVTARPHLPGGGVGRHAAAGLGSKCAAHNVVVVRIACAGVENAAHGHAAVVDKIAGVAEGEIAGHTHGRSTVVEYEAGGAKAEIPANREG